MKRHSAESPCLVCGGHEHMDRGKGERCVGYLSRDGLYCYCSREEHAGGLDAHPAIDPPTWAHRLGEKGCKCGATHAAAVATPAADPPRSSRAGKGPKGRITATYDYTDASGALVFQVVRKELDRGGKSFLQRRPDPGADGGWRWNLQGVERVLYRLPVLRAAAEADAIVFVVEGEKDADALIELGLHATCNPGGAGKWRDAYAETLAGRRVVVLPDADDVGRAHAQAVVASCRAHAKAVTSIELMRGDDGADVSDWLQGNEAPAAHLLELAENALTYVADLDPAELAQGDADAQAVSDDAELAKALQAAAGTNGDGPSVEAAQAAIDAYTAKDDVEVDTGGILGPIPFPDECWVGPFAAYRDAYPHGTTEVADVFRFGSLFGFLGALLTGRRYMEFNWGRLHPSAFVLLAGPPSAKKSTALADLRRAIVWQDLGVDVHGVGTGSSEGLGDLLGARSSKDDDDDDDAEPLVRTGDVDRSRLLVVDELAGLLEGANMQGSTMLAMLQTVYNGEEFQWRYRRKNRQYIPQGLPLSFVSATVPSALWQTVSTSRAGSGFGSRLAVFLGVRPCAVPVPRHRPDLGWLGTLLIELGNLQPQAVTMPEDLEREVWAPAYGALTGERRDRLGHTESTLVQRADQYAQKFMIQLAALQDRTELTEADVTAGIALGNYLHDSMLRLAAFDVPTHGPERVTACERAIISGFERHEAGLTKNELRKAIGGRYNVADVVKTLDLLKQQGRVREAGKSRVGTPKWRLVK